MQIFGVQYGLNLNIPLILHHITSQQDCTFIHTEHVVARHTAVPIHVACVSGAFAIERPVTTGRMFVDTRRN